MADNDAWRAYVELVLGLTETSRKKAIKIVQQVAGKGGATAEQLQDLVGQGLANREAMTRMIRVELDRALGRVGLATMDEVEELTRRVRDLEKELQDTRAAAGMPAVPAASAAEPAPATVPAAGTTAKKTVAKKAARATPAKTAAAKATAAKAAPATTAAKAAPAKTAKTTARKAPARAGKTTAKATGTRAARKTAPGTGR